MKPQCTVLVVDDHPIVRDGITTLLETCERVAATGAARDGDEALAWCRANGEPDVVLMDVRMPGADGFAVFRRLKERWPKIRVIFLTGMPLADELETARAHGARGYLPKTVSRDELLSAIEGVLASDSFFAEENAASAPGILSPRELEIVRYIALGKTQDEIAVIIDRSVETVKSHWKNILLKLDSGNAASAVARAYSLGLLH